MPARRPPEEMPSDPGAALLLGEIRGQLRELIHQVNNEAQKSEARARQLAKLEPVPADIKDIKERLNVLEVDKHRREGAQGFVTWLLKSPLIGWLAGFGLAIFAYFKGGPGQ